MKAICRDMREEYEALDAIVAGLDEAGWKTLTPFLGWDVHYEISHVAYSDKIARLAAAEPETFKQEVEKLFMDESLFEKNFGPVRDMSDADLLEYWRKERSDLIKALEPMGPKDRLPWFGPPMSALSFATARIMETWAHGQDVVDALGIDRTLTDRLRHVAHIGVVTFGWSHAVRGLKVPQTPVRVELTSPSGELWTWGPEKADDVVRGRAEDFCLVVVQRRHVADTDLEIKGDIAGHWMLIAQAFAGEPVTGPKPGERARK